MLIRSAAYEDELKRHGYEDVQVALTTFGYRVHDVKNKKIFDIMGAYSIEPVDPVYLRIMLRHLGSPK